MSEYHDLLLDAYRGELLGQAFFKTLGEAESDPERREKFRALEQVEARTAASLRPLLDRDGVDIGNDEASRRLGTELAAGGAPTWDDFVRGLDALLPDFLAKFQRCRDLAPDPTDPALVALVAHEHAIAAFARAELEGRGDASLGALTTHLATAP